MVCLYVQLSANSDPGQSATEGETQQLGKKFLTLYSIEWEHIEWSSTYRIRQGVADRYSLDHRVFLGGDAGHIHSIRIEKRKPQLRC